MSFTSQLFYRLLVVAIVLTGAGLLFAMGYPYTGTFALVTGLLCLGLLYGLIRNRALTYDKTLEAILQDDFSSRLPASYRNGSFDVLYRLFESQKKRRYEQASREEVFQSLLHDLDTAILILKKNAHDWDVFLMNRHFSQLFGVPSFKKWSMLASRLPAFCSVIETNGFAEMKTSAEIRIDEKENQIFSVRTSRSESFGDTYYSILLDSIQSVVEKKEKQAWVNLMNVISHELMNSLTPIQSLSQSLQEAFADGELSQDDAQDVRQSLSTIANRTRHLQVFVENYRKLTLLPSPAKVPSSVAVLLGDCLNLMAPLLTSEGIAVVHETEAVPEVRIDRQQMEQVFINLLTNGIHALKDRPEKTIRIKVSVESGRLHIAFSDSGKGVENEIRDKIFQPFFTTRKDGAGIGLTLSRNIVEAHGGYLQYAPEGDMTRFVITIPL